MRYSKCYLDLSYFKNIHIFPSMIKFSSETLAKVCLVSFATYKTITAFETKYTTIPDVLLEPTAG